MQAVIMAGGFGSRIAHLYPDIPKPLILIDDKPVIVHQLMKLKENGITDFFILTSYKNEAIKNALGDGSRFGVNIKHFTEEVPLGTAGGIYFLKNLINDNFLLINGDIFFDFYVEQMKIFHERKKADITLFVHPSTHMHDSTLVQANENEKVIDIIPKSADRSGYYKNISNAGIHIISPVVFEKFKKAEKIDFDRDVLTDYIKKGSVYAYKSPEYVCDMGTPERLDKVRKDNESGIVSLKNIKNNQKCVFLDRDGTINKLNGFIKTPDELDVIPEAYEAIKRINKTEMLCIIITNQPVVARGECSIKTLGEIHRKLETALGKNGCYVDAIYYCPHHPDSGFEGENKSFKIQCECRKPKAGLIKKAMEDFNIHEAIMIGDSDNDILAGRSAGLKTAKIGEFTGAPADYYGSGILECLNKYLERDGQ